MDRYVIDQMTELTRPMAVQYGKRGIPIVYGDQAAHTWRVAVMNNGEPADLSAYRDYAGYFLRADGVTVKVEGQRNGHCVTATLPIECYAVAGMMKGLLRAENAASTVTLGAAVFDVLLNTSDVYVDPGEAYTLRYIHIKYAHDEPQSDEDMSDVVDEWFGHYYGTSHLPPEHYTDYTWQKLGGKGDRGETGETGPPGPGGAPSGVYATAAALAAANPDHDSVYLVLADGKWYYWNSSAWAAGGMYQASTPDLRLAYDIKGTVQTPSFVMGRLAQVTHRDAATQATVRTDAYTYAGKSITETRTLATGETLTLVSFTDTLVTEVQ